jgi:hypothetical protein
MSADRKPRARAARAVASEAPPVTRIRKRDGREVPFRRVKIQTAVAAAMEAAGEPDAEFAGEIAAVVELALAQDARNRGGDDAGGYVPHIEDIQDLVERALMDLGRAESAKSFILYRDRRARIRTALRVHDRASAGPGVRVHDSTATSGWSKGRIVAALMEEAELPRATAEEVAGRVEERVFASGLRRVTSGLIRELVAGELFERGLTRALRRQGSVGVPRHDLSRLLAGASLRSWDARPMLGGGLGGGLEGASDPRTGATARDDGSGFQDAVAAEVMRRHVVEEVLPAGLAELHLAGDLHVEDLGRPHLSLAAAVDADLLTAGEPSPSTAFELLEQAAALARALGSLLVLERPGTVLAPLARGARTSSPLGLGSWLRAVTATASAARRRIDLGAPGPRHPALTARLIEELDGLPAGRFTPALAIESGELAELVHSTPDLAPLVDRLLASGRLTPTWSSPDERTSGPGLRRRRSRRSSARCPASARRACSRARPTRWSRSACARRCS